MGEDYKNTFVVQETKINVVGLVEDNSASGKRTRSVTQPIRKTMREEKEKVCGRMKIFLL